MHGNNYVLWFTSYSGVMKNGMHRDRRRQTGSFTDAVGTPGMFPYNSIMFLNNTTKSSKYSVYLYILAHVTEYLKSYHIIIITGLL